MSQEPVVMKPGSTLRFRVEDLQRGVESSTWSLVSTKKTRDFYFANRQIMGDLKFSFHQSGKMRMAWTKTAAPGQVEPGVDRV